jgi:hypothetical protein
MGSIKIRIIGRVLSHGSVAWIGPIRSVIYVYAMAQINPPVPRSS